jgi:predicted HicB family RNase H-like nuclease
MAKQTTSFLVRIEPSWAKEVKKAAKGRGLSQNAWLSLAIRRLLDDDPTAETKK